MGGMFPIVVTTIGVGMVPNADAGIIAIGDIAVVDVDEVGTGTGVMEGDGRAGIAGGCGAGTVEPG